jgi:ABC-type transport system substrate-binding protein
MTTTTNARPAHRRRVPTGRFLLLIVLLIAVTACSAPAAPTTGSTAASAAEPANVTTGEPELAEVQELTAGISRNLVNGEEDWIYAHASLQVWEPLIRYDDQLQPYPGLAEKWTLSDDGLTWTFELRKDVNFSDGEPFNAEAAVAAIKRFAVVSGRPSIFLGGINFPEIYGEPTAIEVVDEFSFRIVYATPRPLLPYSIANHYSAMLSPKVFAENGDIIGLPIGTGPYKLVDWKLLGGKTHTDQDHPTHLPRCQLPAVGAQVGRGRCPGRTGRRTLGPSARTESRSQFCRH